MRQRGCHVPDDFVKFRPCPGIESARAGFDLEEGVIVCTEHVRTASDARQALRHELIHAFDHCRANVDWDDLQHLACTEVRAENLSGECSFRAELARGNVGLVKHHQACVRRRAVLSVMLHPKCESKKHAEEVVDKVFSRCFADTEPYDRIP